MNGLISLQFNYQTDHSLVSSCHIRYMYCGLKACLVCVTYNLHVFVRFVVVCSLPSFILSYNQLVVKWCCVLKTVFPLMLNWCLTMHVLCGVMHRHSQILQHIVGFSTFNSCLQGLRETSILILLIFGLIFLKPCHK